MFGVVTCVYAVVGYVGADGGVAVAGDCCVDVYDDDSDIVGIVFVIVAVVL